MHQSPPQAVRPRWPAIRGLICDLDGTLADSALDFEAMRAEMQIEPGRPILEALEQLPEARAAECRAILDRHEQAGVDRAVLFPGVLDFLDRVTAHGWKRAILTRNSRAISIATLQKFGVDFHPIMAREDAPPKPDPAAIWIICKAWGTEPNEVAIIGDYRYDLEAGRAAGCRTVLFTAGRAIESLPYAHLADFVLDSFVDAERLFHWLGEST